MEDHFHGKDDTNQKTDKKAYYDRKRGTWGNIDPVSKVIESKKIYKRNRNKRREREIYGTEVW